MRRIAVTTFILLSACCAFGQDMWKYFTPEDFARRRSAVIEKIPDGVAIFLGAELPEAYVKFRQDNTFYYLTGVEIPDAVLVLNGKSKTATLFVPEEMHNDIKQEAWIKPGQEAAELYKFNRVASRKGLSNALAQLVRDATAIYLHLAPEEIAGMSRDRSLSLQLKRMNDPWDGRIPKETAFANLIKERFAGAAVKNIAPIIDEMRWVKDEKEIVVLRECGRIGALGFNEAIKITRPGVYEHQVVAACDFVYQYNGAQNPAFYAIAASGERGLIWHYNANNHSLRAGDVILLDYAPDLNYYVTDITRTWPVEGKFSDYQLKLYNCIKDMRANVIAAIKPGVTYADLQKVGKETFEKQGFGKFWFGYVGHFVGMAVHDEGPRDKPFVPGVVFNVEPIIEDKEQKIHLRLEDTVVVTANGAEVLTTLTPVEPDAIYRLIQERGIWEN
jgi:Xaa-Pro aminopeptidase